MSQPGPLRDDEGNVAESKAILVSVWATMLLAFIAVFVMIALTDPPTGGAPGVWERYEGLMKWGSGVFLGSSTLLHIGHRYTHKPASER